MRSAQPCTLKILITKAFILSLVALGWTVALQAQNFQVQAVSGEKKLSYAYIYLNGRVCGIADQDGAFNIPHSKLHIGDTIPASYVGARPAFAVYTKELAGESANIIFGAMYDESTPDTCSITVIATGLEAQESAGQTSTFMKKANERPAFNSGASSFKTAAPTQRTPITKSEATVGTSTIQIPSFLQKK